MRPQLIVGALCLLAAAGASAAVLGAQAQPPEPARPSFAEWLSEVKSEALSRGIREDIVSQALDSVEEPLPVVLERDRTQAEIILPLETYVTRRLTRRMITSGREVYRRHRMLLEDVGVRYGVSPRIIVAIWGVESNYGRFSGVRPTVAALATLAWDPRRATFFRGELFNALEILNRGDIELPRMKGSWAGAMGQPQFMPSSYLQFAQDYDGDGRRDIWGSPADVFASVANYLKGNGWIADERWGREVSVPPDAAAAIAEVAKRPGSCRATREMSASLPIAEWSRLGVRALGSGALPKAEMRASLVSGASRHFLVYGNYDALLSYNCAHAYAISVALLADRIGGAEPGRGARPRTKAAASGSRSASIRLSGHRQALRPRHGSRQRRAVRTLRPGDVAPR